VVYPMKASEFAALQAQGLTVDYAETESASARPDGAGWELWSERVTDESTVAVWRRITAVEELT
jgi:hypothetical protein